LTKASQRKRELSSLGLSILFDEINV